MLDNVPQHEWWQEEQCLGSICDPWKVNNRTPSPHPPPASPRPSKPPAIAGLEGCRLPSSSVAGTQDRMEGGRRSVATKRSEEREEEEEGRSSLWLLTACRQDVFPSVCEVGWWIARRALRRQRFWRRPFVTPRRDSNEADCLGKAHGRWKHVQQETDQGGLGLGGPGGRWGEVEGVGARR